MSYDASRAVSAYTTVSLETAVQTASRHQLILMLMDGALKAVRLAGACMREHRVAEKGERIGQAIAIFDELIASLDLEVGGEIASNLEALYSYMSNRLLDATLHDREDVVHEVSRLLGELREAWATIESNPTAPMPQLPPVPSADPPARDPISYGKA
ncbi:MAG: flagellar export chaperone FliS [Nitrospirota bacterium]